MGWECSLRLRRSAWRSKSWTLLRSLLAAASESRSSFTLAARLAVSTTSHHMHWHGLWLHWTPERSNQECCMSSCTPCVMHQWCSNSPSAVSSLPLNDSASAEALPSALSLEDSCPFRVATSSPSRSFSLCCARKSSLSLRSALPFLQECTASSRVQNAVRADFCYLVSSKPATPGLFSLVREPAERRELLSMPLCTCLHGH